MAALALVALLALLGAAPPPDADTLAVVDNTLRHEAPPPRSAPPLTSELLARPLDARDAAAIFDRAVPRPLLEAAPAFAGAGVVPAQAGTQSFDKLLSAYVAELALAREELMISTGNAPLDVAALLAEIREAGHPSTDRLLQVEAATDRDGLAVANERFISATVRFAWALRSATDLPAETTRIETAVGTIVIGSRGDDVHELTPAADGAISVVIDLGGNDTYHGANVAVRGFSAIIDLAGDDRYELSGAGLGAAVAGASLVLDFAGNDRYRAPHLAQGAAAFGVGALIDLAGDDQYDVNAWGQGFAIAGGIALLWDVAGNDRYTARGPADPFNRGGGLSGAQGVAMGPRNLLAGGIGILRDDAGDDVYVAEMFAQGAAYYYGVGLLWDRGGNDRYEAVRYAQGAGVHEAVGVLRDEAGNDRYVLKVGVGQGIGVDLSVGVLADAAGDDEYAADSFAQGTATSNGIGILEDAGGADRFEVSGADRHWGQAYWEGGLPGTGIFLHDATRASFTRNGKPVPAPSAPRKLIEPEHDGTCPAGIRVAPAEIDSLRRGDFDAVYTLGERLTCALSDAEQARVLWPVLETELVRRPETPLAAWIALAYRRQAPPPPFDRSVLERLDAHPHCSVRALALAAAPRSEAAHRGLRSSCYRQQAAAIRALQKLGEPVPADAPLPAFLR